MTQEVIHGVSKHQYYKRWNDMVQRCFNPLDVRYPLYGGAGIAVDPEWDRRNPKGAFNYVVWVEERVAEMPIAEREKLFLVVRRDKTKNYGPNNCFLTDNREASQDRSIVVLTFDKVAEMRRYKRENMHVTLREMCTMFNIDHVYTLSKSLQGLSWSNVNNVEPPVKIVPRNKHMVAQAATLKEVSFTN